MKQYIYVMLWGDDSFDIESFRMSLPEPIRGSIKHPKSNIPCWESNEILTIGDDYNEVEETTESETISLLTSLRDEIVALIHNGNDIHVMFGKVIYSDISFFEACEDPCNEDKLDYEECLAAGKHVCGNPYVTGGFHIPAQAIRLMADMGASFEYDQYFYTPKGGIPWRK